MRNLHRLLAGLLIVSAAACSERLAVTNLNNPDRDRALARPSDVEALIAGSFKTIWDNIEGTNNNIRAGMWQFGLESYANLANWNQVVFGQIPRVPIPNTRGNQASDVNFQQYAALFRAARTAAVGLGRVSDPTFTFFPASAAQTNRAKAFANLVIGVALGYASLAFDSGAVITKDDPAGTPVPLPLAAYDSVNRAAIRYLQVADSLAGLTPSGLNGFPLPTAWISVPAANLLDATNFRALTRAYRAMFRAAVARSPTEAAAVNWDSVIANANSFVTTYAARSAFEMSLTTISPTWTVGGGGSSQQQMHLYGAWHQMWQFMIGMADTSGSYAAWLALPRGSRTAFLVLTPDQRFPSGNTRALQNTASGITGSNDDVMPTAGTPWYMGKPYFRNRLAGNDLPGEPLASSMYDHYRLRRYGHASGFNGIGVWPYITVAEMRLLAAEGNLMKGNVAAALPLIDASRTAQGGLPALVGAITTTSDPVPGGNACVPRVPDPATNFTSTKCGNVWEALKWEWRMEVGYTSWGDWYFAGRRWGDLPEGTAINWPTPYQELDTRREPLYQLGGLGQTGGQAFRGTYGL